MHKLRLEIIAALVAVSALATPSSAQQKPADAAKPDAAKPDAAKPDPAKPDAAKPDPAKPDPAKPDAAKPDPAKPDAAKPDAAKPDAAKPDAAKPAPVAPPKPAAPTPADIESAKQHYIAGAELVDQGKHAEAVKEFKESYRLSRNPLLLYNIGFVYDELKDKNMALFYYRKFLADAPGKSDNHDFARKRLRKLARELDADAVFSGGGTTSGGAGDTTDTGAGDASAGGPADVKEFMHQVVEEAPPGKPLDITAFTPRNARWQLTLSYRAQGDTKWTTTVMKVRYNEMVGRIPAAKIAGSTVQYYIEVKDRAGKIIARSGRANSPNIVFVDAKARAQYYPDFGGGDEQYTKVGGGGGGGGATFTPTGDGWFDVGSDRFTRVKWGTTAAAAGLVTTALISYFVAADASSNMEAEAFNSNRSDNCANGAGVAPCIQYSDFQKDTEAQGQRYQTIYRVTMSLGLITGGVAGYLWYKEISAKKRASRGGAVTVVPVIGPDVVGGAAAFEF